MIYDIARPVNAQTAVWPGDQPYRLRHTLRRSEGAFVNLTALEATLHLGTHMDAWYHSADDGAAAAQMPLSACIGPARLVTLTRNDGPLEPADLAHVSLAGVQRLLLRSAVSELAAHAWPTAWPWPGAELIEELAAGGLQSSGSGFTFGGSRGQHGAAWSSCPAPARHCHVGKSVAERCAGRRLRTGGPAAASGKCLCLASARHPARLAALAQFLPRQHGEDSQSQGFDILTTA